eukprot:scaffold50363_cov46-Prasinocladus_malaysianus.AAC.1
MLRVIAFVCTKSDVQQGTSLTTEDTTALLGIKWKAKPLSLYVAGTRKHWFDGKFNPYLLVACKCNQALFKLPIP